MEQAYTRVALILRVVLTVIQTVLCTFSMIRTMQIQSVLTVSQRKIKEKSWIQLKILQQLHSVVMEE
jgi:hypothetical protein